MDVYVGISSNLIASNVLTVRRTHCMVSIVLEPEKYNYIKARITNDTTKEMDLGYFD